MIKNDYIEELFELVLVDEEDGVFANSLVAAGAIERDFVAFHKEYAFAAVSDEKMLIAGPMLIPNKKILRLKDNGEKYWVYFKPETIEKISRKFNKQKLGDQITLEHGNKTSGIYMVENWIVEHPTKDKSNLYGFTLPKGSWFAVYSAEENPKVWDRVKAGEFNGFSIEGLFEHQKSDVKLALEKNIEDLTDDEAEVLLGQIKAIIRKDKRYKSKQWIEMETFNDYGSGVRNNAKRGRELNEKNGNKCATQTGKVRSAQLEAGENISVATLKRMFSYLSRAETYYDNADSQNDCGYISYLLWGGKAGLAYSRNKLRELGLLEETEAQPSIPNSTYPGEAAKKRKKQDMAIVAPNINVFGYHTRYFHMCKGAQELFNHLITMPVDEETIGMIRSAAQVADNIFRKEEEVIKAGVASQHDYEEVVLLVDDFKDIMHEIDEEVGMQHDVSFMDNHIMKVKEYYNDK